MSEMNHHDYYVARAETSRNLAARAANPAIAAIHSELAGRYAGMAAQLERNGETGADRQAV